MKRRVVSTTSIILLLLVSMATGALFTKADPVFVYEYPVVVSLFSPQDNAAFTRGSFRVDFSITDVPRDKVTYQSSIVFTVLAIVDENYTARVDVHFDLSRPSTPQEYSVELSNITDGTHTLRVLAGYFEGDSICRHFTELTGSSKTIHFSVGTTQKPNSSVPPSSPNTTNQQTQNSWSTVASMPTAWQRAQTAVVNGKIYVIGNYINKGTYQLINYEYDPAADSWQTNTPTPLSRYGASMVVYQNKIYLVSGFTGGGVNPPATFVYDPAADSWTSEAPASIVRMDVLTSVVAGKIYVTGGTGTNPYDPSPTFVETEVYDIANNSWSRMAPIPVAVTRGFSVVMEGKIYIVGHTKQADLIVQIFDPKNNYWSQGSNPPISVERFSSAVADNKIFLIGGSDNYSYPTLIQNSLQVYDPKTDTWSLMAPLPVGVFWPATGLTTGLMAPERIYVFGGCNDTSFSRTNLTQVYNPANDSWTMGE